MLPGKVSMYSCGPTAHARMHPGECRRMVFADLLSRYLEFRGYSMAHIVNITDLDDKTINGSEKAGVSLTEFTEKHIKTFHEDLDFLKIKPATKYPRVSEHVEDMVALSKRLVTNGYAYEKLRSLYFNIARFSEYGKLSGIDVNKVKVGATVDLDDYEKDNPRDFTLLKRSKLSELKRGIYTKTDWGNVRPSWHLQCAAISMKHLGESFDIHTSSRELVFPHHENEIAIASAVTGKPLAKYWIHCDRVLADGKKIEENEPGFSLSDFADMGFSGREIRYWLLSTHYHKPITFSKARLEYAKHSLKRIDTCIQSLLNVKAGQPYPEIDQLLYNMKHEFTRAMDDDLNISVAIASIFNIVKKVNILIHGQRLNSEDAVKIVDVFRKIDAVLRVCDFNDAWSDADIKLLMEKRGEARQEKNWQLADQIRDQLRSLGVMVRDSNLN